jgi:hypothetical protein
MMILASYECPHSVGWLKNLMKQQVALLYVGKYVIKTASPARRRLDRYYVAAEDRRKQGVVSKNAIIVRNISGSKQKKQEGLTKT